MTKTTKKPSKSTSKDTKKDPKSKLPDWMLGLTYACIALAVILSAAKIGLQGMQYKSLYQNDTYQAVTLTNGQTFFGQMERYGRNTFVITDVYYLQSAQTEVSDDALTESVASGLQLVPLTEDLHQPYNHMVLNREHIIYWQNLQPDSPIMEAITKQ